MTKWVNCFLMPTGLLRGEQTYRIRRHNNTVVEGYCGRKDWVPVWARTLQRKDKRKNLKELRATWGYMEVSILEEGSSKTLIGLPDDQVVLVSSIKLHDKLPELSSHVFDS